MKILYTYTGIHTFEETCIKVDAQSSDTALFRGGESQISEHDCNLIAMKSKGPPEEATLKTSKCCHQRELLRYILKKKFSFATHFNLICAALCEHAAATQRQSNYYVHCLHTGASQYALRYSVGKPSTSDDALPVVMGMWWQCSGGILIK
ncbi:unnamed protein product [Ceratitis capitata]|uniref:(Mediterranean fruit fly) hypothetical protein n=1 Tax=Ceratitis capitata TaxID=7213 RepID=A0A811V829_CERCA|nr:unnamed protein product [Ceratitis capitata]